MFSFAIVYFFVPIKEIGEDTLSGIKDDKVVETGEKEEIIPVVEEIDEKEEIIPVLDKTVETEQAEEIVMPTPTPLQPSYEYIDYVVKKGDYLFRITESYTGDGFDYPKIQSENKIPNADLIYPDQVIKIKVEKEKAE